MALQRDGEAKSRQLEEAQAQSAQLVENLRQAQALNAALQTKILTIGEGSGARPLASNTGQWYWVVVAVLLSLIGGLALWLLLG